MASSSDPPVLEPLQLADHSPKGVTRAGFTSDKMAEVTCVLCDGKFDISETMHHCLRHLLLEHKLVIADVKIIADFPSYMEYWREKFKDKELTEYCSVIKTNTKESDQGPSEFYYLLCDVLPEDKQLRVALQKTKLEEVLAQQQREREDEHFSHMCLFCREVFTGNRQMLFDHMATDHSFTVGHYDNLVYTSELLDKLDAKLHSLQCLYCEKTFKDRQILKEHMRKKQHKRIDPKNTSYDKYYIINYLEFGKNWEAIQAEKDVDLEVSDSESSVNDEWSDWTEDGGAQAVCLFCDHSSATSPALLHHMKDSHQFDLAKIIQEHNLTFYQQVKLINYIRRQMHQKSCTVCEESFTESEALQRHLVSTQHISLAPPVKAWDQPQYFFPTYENDNLLCSLEGVGGDEDDASLSSDTSALSLQDTVVVAEDLPVTDSILSEQGLREQLLS